MFTRLIALLTFVVALTGRAPAQAPLVEIQDSLILSRVIPSSGDTVPEEKFSAAYEVQMVYDTTTVQYTLTEVKHNETRPELLNWTFNAEHLNWDDATMSDSSRTDAVLVRAGDSISFYREFGWWNAADGRFDTTLIIDDTLDFAVELVRADGSRASLLDSMGILRRVTRGVPSFRGTGPIMRRVSYSVPSSLDSESVFVRLRVYTRGSGATYPIRIDNATVALSDRLTSSSWATYRSMFNFPFAKRRVSDLETATRLADPAGRGLQVTARGGSGTIEIDYSGHQAEVPLSVVVYSITGDEIARPLDDALQPTGVLRLTNVVAGTYFVVLSAGSRRLSVTSVNVR